MKKITLFLGIFCLFISFAIVSCESESGGGASNILCEVKVGSGQYGSTTYYLYPANMADAESYCTGTIVTEIDITKDYCKTSTETAGYDISIYSNNYNTSQSSCEEGGGTYVSANSIAGEVGDVGGGDDGGDTGNTDPPADTKVCEIESNPEPNITVTNWMEISDDYTETNCTEGHQGLPAGTVKNLSEISKPYCKIGPMYSKGGTAQDCTSNGGQWIQ